MVLRSAESGRAQGRIPGGIDITPSTVTHMTGTYPGFIEDEDWSLPKRFDAMHKLICDQNE